MGLSIRLLAKVRGFTLDVEWEMDRELAVIFGFSGAGKSMTLQMIAGLMKPDEGKIRVNDTIYYDRQKGIDVPPYKRNIGYVFQDCALFPHMTVSNNIEYGLKDANRTTRKKKVAEMLEAFRIEGLANKYPCEISGGQKQRTAFARALIRRPEALLLDEPFSALDIPIRLEMRKLLKEIRLIYDIPIVLVTHDIFEVVAMADRLTVYRAGKVIQAGRLQEVLNDPVTEEVQTLLGFSDLIPKSEFFRNIS